ncbi:MAG: hypothetical protein ACRDHM_05670 [Actinomycetota bacterium]
MTGKKTRWIVGVALAVVLIGGGAAIAIASGGDADKPLHGSNLERATSAALEHTGGGTVVETEVGDDGAAYGIEIRLDDGSVVEVNLDDSFEVIGEEADEDRGSDGEADSDD